MRNPKLETTTRKWSYTMKLPKIDALDLRTTELRGETYEWDWPQAPPCSHTPVGVWEHIWGRLDYGKTTMPDVFYLKGEY